MNQHDVAAVLAQFAKFGFRRTSMDDIASAAGLSRQTVYNRFGSKEGAFAWVLSAFLGHLLEAALTELEPADRPAEEALLAAYERWIGDHVELMVKTDHGLELLDQALQAKEGANSDVERRFAERVAAFLRERGVAATADQADDITFLLSVAGKGIMLKSATAPEFSASMARVIGLITR